MPARPKTSRPHMPGYGISRLKRGLLPWKWAVERLAKARNYFLATTRPGGRPHVMPVWGVWLDGAFWFSTGRQSRKARNLAAIRHCVVCPERGEEAVVLEGEAVEIVDRTAFRRFAENYYAKYKWKVEPEMGPVFAVRPRVAFGLIEAGDKFTTTATRWTFSRS